MGRTPIPFDQSPAREIYENYRQWALDSKTFPNPHAFWRLMYGPDKEEADADLSALKRAFRKKVQFRLTWSGFNYHWMQLQIKDLIRIEETTGSVQVMDLDVILRDAAGAA